VAAHAEAVRQMVDPLFEQQLKVYEQAVQHFQAQKLAKAKELLEKAIAGPSKIRLAFLAFVSFLAFKEYVTLIPTRRADRRILFWAYLAIAFPAMPTGIRANWVATVRSVTPSTIGKRRVSLTTRRHTTR